jgi:magnesium-transporting ATPase (P-type)
MNLIWFVYIYLAVPDNLTVTLSYYTSSGFRVIAVAYKELPKKFKWTQAQRASREQVTIIFLISNIINKI